MHSRHGRQPAGDHLVFRSLPIQFDSYGRAQLRDEDVPEPFDFVIEARRQRARQREQFVEQSRGRAGFRHFVINPQGSTTIPPGIIVALDLDQRRILDAQAEGGEYSPQELVIINRKPSDAVTISARTRGGAGGAHTIAASLALEMAGGITPPPLAIITRNLGSCGEMIAECIRHLSLHTGPDYSEEVFARSSPAILEVARRTPAPGAAIHGYDSIGDILQAFNRLRGELCLEGLRHFRIASEVTTLVFGRSIHPTTLFPGGNGIQASRETFNLLLGRVTALLDYAKKISAVWDDLIEFLYEADPRFRRLGELPANLISVGLWEDPETYDGSYANCNEWGARRLSTPGAIVNGEKRTDRLTDLNIGIEEFVDSAHYAEWQTARFSADPLSSPLSPRHPWNRETLPLFANASHSDTAADKISASGGDARRRHTWLSAPRWDREAMECGPLARLWVNALNVYNNCEFIDVVRGGLEINIPKGQQEARRLLWRIPERSNALERNRAAACQIGYAGMVAYASLLRAFDCLRHGETQMSNPFMLPARSIGAGFWESAGGALTHHVVVRNQQITNYQIIPPSEWIFSSRDASETPGVIEAAIHNTPLTEDFTNSEDFTGIDILRVLRSFAP